MEENLLGYLLGALDSAEHETIKEKISRDPELQAQLAALEARLAPLEANRCQFEPPDHLAARTCARVASYGSTEDMAVQPAAHKRLAPYHESGGDGSSRGWSVLDVVIAAGVFFAASLLFFPALLHSHHTAKKELCQMKLRTLGTALSQFAEKTNGLFPSIPSSGPYAVAGCYAPQLKHAGFVLDDADFVCPGAKSKGWNVTAFRVPRHNELTNPGQTNIVVLQKRMGGSFGYNLGHFENGQYRSPRNYGRDNYPLMADAPKLTSAGHVSTNHGGKGQNVLFEAGNVQYLNTATVDPYDVDNIFLNDEERVAAGLHPSDAVIGPSGASPFTIKIKFTHKPALHQ